MLRIPILPPTIHLDFRELLLIVATLDIQLFFNDTKIYCWPLFDIVTGILLKLTKTYPPTQIKFLPLKTSNLVHRAKAKQS